MSSGQGRAARLAMCLVGAALCVLASSARAQSAPDAAHDAVMLAVPDCLGASGSEVKKLVALELAPRMRVLPSSSMTTALTGTVRCAAPHALISVVDPRQAEPLHVELDLAAAAPQARERLLALTLAELITTSQLEPAATQPAATQPLATQPSATQPAAQPTPDAEPPSEDEGDELAAAHPLQLWVAPSFSVAGEPAAPLYGGSFGASHALGPLLLSLELQAQFGQSDRTASDVALRVLSACVGLAPLLMDGSSQLSAGLGLRVGHIAMSASAQRADLEAVDFSGFWLGPALLVAWHLPVLDPSALRLAFEAGYIARPVIGLDERSGQRMALRGAWLTASVGFAFRMP